MTDLVITAAQVARIYPESDEVFDLVKAAATTLTKGQGVYVNTSGLAVATDANAGSGAQAVKGIVIGVRGNAVSVMKRGWLEGMGVSGLAYGAKVYLSDTAGALADAPSATNPVQVGVVMPLPNHPTLTKALYIDLSGSLVTAQPIGTIFVSAETTATGSAQNVAHGLGVVPRYILVTPTEHPGTPDTGAFDVAEGTHTSTNVVLTVTINVKFKVLAIA